VQLELSCTRCLTRFTAFQGGREALVAKCPGCGKLCEGAIDPAARMRVRSAGNALIFEPTGAAAPHGRFRCLDCGREAEVRVDGAAALCPHCRSGRLEATAPIVTAIGLGQSGVRALTRAELKRQRFIHRWHGNFETLRQKADGLREAMVALEFAADRQAEVDRLLSALVREAEAIKEAKIERYLARSGDGEP